MMQKQYKFSQKVFNNEYSCQDNLYALCVSYAIQPTKSLQATLLFWEANSSTSQEISYILCNPKGHYHIDKQPPLLPIQSQHFFKMHPTIYA